VNTAPASASTPRVRPRWRFRPTQEGIVFLLTMVLFLCFAWRLDGFLTSGNVITLLRSVSVLGMLALGMCLVVVGRGVDLSMVASMVVGMCWALKMSNDGTMDFHLALLAGAGFVVLCGVATGIVVAFAEIPAVFTTLAMGSVIFGVGNAFFFSTDTHNAPANLGWLQTLGYGSLLGVPLVIYLFALLALAVHLVLRTTRLGRSIYAMGDNPQAARLTGFPVRPIIVAQYVSSGLIAYAVALIVVASNSGMNTRLFYTTLVYDVLLVVVLGGIGLGGGRGGVRNVLVGTLLVGVLTSGMTIMNLSYTVQNLVKALVMLSALIADTFVNPRDEQTAQQGDI